MTSSVDFEVQVGAKAVQVAGGQGTQTKPDVTSGAVAKTVEAKLTTSERELHDFNKAIHSVCSNIDSLISDILKEKPEL